LAADLAAGSGEQAKAFTLDPAVYDRVQPVVVHRELRLSASALLEYDNCPRSFFYHYRLQMPGIEPEVTGTGTGRISAIRLGTYVHRVLELQLKGCPLEEALDEALAVLGDDNRKELREDEEGEDTLTQAMKTTFRREGKKLVDQYCASPLYQGMAGQQAQAEVGFELPLYTFEDGTVVFQGSIDRLVDLGGDQLGIVDYKTGHPPTGGEERQGYTRQLTIYAKAAEALYPGRNVAWVRLHFLQDCSSWELQDRPREEKKLEQLLEKLVQYKDEDQFPVVQTNCKFCPYSYFCKKE
ncbi:PD-(D/E)XK nuclease family protein, partial [Acidaminococcus timonensis]|uniref:RecB family exonuclease n=1 Tax=Acidaminococcus timonensis TaxID=1871002 RepID=UPI00307844D2